MTPRDTTWRDVLHTMGRGLDVSTPFDPYTLAHRDPSCVRAMLPVFEQLARGYLRLQVSGREHITARPTLYVANHNGGIMGPDLFCTLSVLWRTLEPSYPLYAMAHDFAMRRILPLGRLLQSVGAMRADPDNARRVFERGGSVLVYPGGDLDAYRPFWMRDRIVFGARAGFARVAARAGVPIVPIVAHGAHRSALIVHEGQWLARRLGLTRWSRIQSFPIAFALPWGIGLGPWVPYLPLPFQVRLQILPAIATCDRTPEAIRQIVVERMQAALDAMSSRAGRNVEAQ